MANILLVDPDKVAQMAMGGIVARGGHRFVALDSAAQAWKFIRRNVRIDLVFLELKLGEETGVSLIQDLKEDCILRSIPLIVYTGQPERDYVRQALELRVQNVLLKPYREEVVFAEISKASSEPWLLRYFESDDSDWEPERRNAMLEKLGKALADGQESIGKRKLSPEQSPKPIIDWLKRLSAVASKACAEGVVRCLDELVYKTSAGKWPTGDENTDGLGLAARMISSYLDYERVPEVFMTEAERNEEEEALARAHWNDAVEEDRCPVVGFDQLKREMDNLSSCPIIDSISASFQMSANGSPKSLAPLFDLVYRDPGLTVQILIGANRLKKSQEDGEAPEIEDTRMAIGLLGETRLAAMGAHFENVEERLFDVSARLNWPTFRLFQLGVAHVAKYICEYLEMHNLAQVAYTAGLTHDYGKVILAGLHPYSLGAIQQYAMESILSLEVAEKCFLSCTTQEMAVYYAEKQGLPKRFINVIRWLDRPAEAVLDRDLIAVVSLARDLCYHNKVGYNGGTSLGDSASLNSSPQWALLRNRVYLNFDLERFERQLKGECQAIKREIAGKLPKKAVA